MCYSIAPISVMYTTVTIDSGSVHAKDGKIAKHI